MAEIISALSNGSQVKVVYSYTQSISTNTSTVTAELYVHRDSYGPSTDSSCTSYININGSRAMTYTSGFTIGSSWVKIGSTCTATVAHNDDGTKICNITGYFNSSITTKLENLSVSQNITLTTIPRKSQITAATNDFNIGDGFLIYTNRKSSTFTHAINLYFGSYSTTLVYGITDSYYWDSTSWASSMYQQIPNSNSGTGALQLITYAADDSVIGYTELSFTAHVADSNPTFTNLTYLDTDSATVSLTGNSSQIVQTKSNIRVTVNGAAAKNYAAISTYKAQYGSKTITSSSNVISFGTVSTNDNLTVTLIDSRGNSIQQSVYLTAIPYAVPTVTTAALSRVNNIEAGTVLVCTGTFASIMVTKGQYSLKYRYKPTTSGTWSSYISISPAMNGGSFSFNANIGNFDIGTSFNFEIAAFDYYTSTTKSALLSTAKPVFSIRDGKIGVNKIPENGALDVQGDVYISGSKAYSDGYHPYADTLGGVWPSVAATGNSIPQRDGNGYLYGTYFNSNRANETSAAASYIYDTGDGWMRKKTLANVRAELGGAGSGLNADQVDGVHLLKGTASGTAATQTAYGSIFYSGDITVNFGTTLPSIPVVTNSFITNGFGYCILKSVSTTGFVIKITNAVTSSGVNWGVHWIAAY